MSGTIFFVSGKTLEITEAEFAVIGPKLRDKGIKTQVTREGHLLPLNSSTMELIEHVPEIEVVEVEVAPLGLKLVEGDGPLELPVQEKLLEKPKPKTQEEMLDDMTAKSNCKHEPEKLELYIQHTAKGIRYFPVCSFCGKRERYVSESKINKGEYAGTSNEKWTDADIANAKPWIEA
jgi:hypothetical protein